MKLYCRFLLAAIIFLSACINLCAYSNRDWILLDQTLRFDIPKDFYTIEDTKNAIWAGANKENPNYVAIIKRADVEDFDENLAFARLDSLVFNLSGYTQVDFETEPLFEMSRNYFIKKYVSKEDSTRRIATYTFYSFRYPYTMLIDYGPEDNYASAQGLINGVAKVEVGGWRQLFVFWKFGKGIILAIIFIPIILPALLSLIINRDLAAFITLFITWGLILYSMWGFPVAIIISMLVTLFETIYFGRKKLSEIFD